MQSDRYNHIMQKLSAAFSGNRYEGNANTKRVYAGKFASLDEVVLERAVAMVMDERDFFPSIAVLNRYVRRAEDEVESERASPRVHFPSREEHRAEYARRRAKSAATNERRSAGALAHAFKKAQGVLCPACMLPHYTLEVWQSARPFPPSGASVSCTVCRGTGYDPEVLAGRAPVPRMMVGHLEETRRELAMDPVPGQPVSEPFSDLF